MTVNMLYDGFDYAYIVYILVPGVGYTAYFIIIIII